MQNGHCFQYVIQYVITVQTEQNKTLSKVEIDGNFQSLIKNFHKNLGQTSS